MSERVKMPALGESVTEGTVTRWLKDVGDSVEVDEPLLEVSTDKVDTEIPSPVAGTLQEILVQEDDTVPVGADLAVIGDGAARGRRRLRRRAVRPAARRAGLRPQRRGGRPGRRRRRRAGRRRGWPGARRAAGEPHSQASAAAGSRSSRLGWHRRLRRLWRLRRRATAPP